LPGEGRNGKRLVRRTRAEEGEHPSGGYCHTGYNCCAEEECRSRGAEIGKGVGIRIMLRPATKWTREQWAILEMDCNSVRDHGPNWLDTKIVKPK
jgi:hypothetical protein